jgi:hypothetical protein
MRRYENRPHGNFTTFLKEVQQTNKGQVENGQEKEKTSHTVQKAPSGSLDATYGGA